MKTFGLYTPLYSLILLCQQFQGVEGSRSPKPLQSLGCDLSHFLKIVANLWQTILALSVRKGQIPSRIIDNLYHVL